MRIAYLIPEFPGQTHMFFWRERISLGRIGIETHIVSTRRPAKAIISHDWADEAQLETFYLTDATPADILRCCFLFIGFGPRAWTKALIAVIEDCSPRDWLANFALMLFSVRLIGYMRDRNISHVHSHSCANSALIALFANRLADMTYSLTLHGDLHDYGRQQHVKWRHAAFAITITRKLRDQVFSLLGRDVPPLVGLAPMGVDPAKFKRSRPYTAWNREGALRLFSCGRLNQVKGHQDLIRAVSILRNSGMNVRLEIAGEDEIGGGGFHRELATLIAELKLESEVVLLGAVAEQKVLEGLEAAHLFILASHHEPLGVAIMEAMSCETPVIATDRGGVPELIDHGLDGFLISPRDSEALAAAIRFLADHPAAAMNLSMAGRPKVLERFNSDVSAVELKRLLEQMM